MKTEGETHKSYEHMSPKDRRKTDAKLDSFAESLDRSWLRYTFRVARSLWEQGQFVVELSDGKVRFSDGVAFVEFCR